MRKTTGGPLQPEGLLNSLIFLQRDQENYKDDMRMIEAHERYHCSKGGAGQDSRMVL